MVASLTMLVEVSKTLFLLQTLITTGFRAH